MLGEQPGIIARMPTSTNPDVPRPTQLAFKPATPADVRSGWLIAGLCLLAGLMSVAGWVWGTQIFGPTGGWRTERDLANLLLFGWLGLPIGLYFAIATGQAWWRTTIFRRTTRPAIGQITHLWEAPDDNGKRKYYMGYHYLDTFSAYQPVTKRSFQRLSVGQPITVHYQVNVPTRAYANLPRRPRATKVNN